MRFHFTQISVKIVFFFTLKYVYRPFYLFTNQPKSSLNELFLFNCAW